MTRTYDPSQAFVPSEIKRSYDGSQAFDIDVTHRFKTEAKHADLVIPGSGLSLRSVVGRFRDLFNHPLDRIGGEITHRRGEYQLMLRANNLNFEVWSCAAQDPQPARDELLPSGTGGVPLSEPDACAASRHEKIAKVIERAALELAARRYPFVVAWPLFQKGSHKAARKIIEPHMGRKGLKEWQYALASNIEMALGKEDQAFAYSEQAHGKTAEQDAEPSKWFYFDRAFGYEEAGEHERAIKDYSTALDLDPELGAAWNNRGNAYAVIGEFDRAISDYDEALDLDPDNVTTLTNRGVAYDDIGQHEQAIKDYDEALRLDPGYVDSWINRGNTYSALGKFDRAIRDYDEALSLDPGDAISWNNRGMTYTDKGNYDAAIRDHDEALRLDPVYVDAWINRGNTYSAKHEFERAISDYDEAISLDPDRANSSNGRGRTRFYLGRFLDAAEDFAHAVELQPKDLFAPLWRYMAERRAGRDAHPHLSRSAEILDLNRWPGPVIRRYLGKISSEEVLEEAHDATPKRVKEKLCEAYFYLGQIALFEENLAEAERLFRAAIDTGVTNFLEYTGSKVELNRMGSSL